MAATLALWLAATLRHAFTARPEPAHERDMHEVIHPEKATKH